MTREQAIALMKTRFWEDLDDRQRAMFQLRVGRLCMPFDVFHRSLEKALMRPVWTHEMGLHWEGLLQEVLGECPAPTMEEIIALIPEEKRIIFDVRSADDE